MKNIEKLGSWILDTRSGFIFGSLLVLIAIGTIGFRMYTGPKVVAISSSDFVCVQTEPSGMDAICTQYRRIH